MTCPEYVDQLFDSEFRGVPFDSLRTRDGGGQRGPNHQFPHRQTPYAEFLGRKIKTLTVEGFFNGEDHLLRAADLIRALDDPSPGTLVHPAFGRRLVKVETYSIEQDYEERLGETRFTLECVEAGALSYPEGVVIFGSEVFTAVEAIRERLPVTFADTFEVATLPTHLAAESLVPVQEGAEEYAAAFSGHVTWSADTSDVYEALVVLRDTPSTPSKSIAQTFTEAAQAIGIDYRSGRKVQAVARLDTLMRFRPSVEATSSTGPRAATTNENINVVMLTARIAALAEQARLVLEDEDYFASYSAALQWLAGIQALLDQELDIAVQRLDDDLYDALQELKRRISSAIFRLAPSLPTRRIVSTCRPLPSLLAAYRVYGSIEKVGELEDANNSASSWWMPDQLEVVRDET